ncbi:bacterial regulatory helix-turn-helix, lysR family protein [Collimonas arenae]|uniref:Bacterial regulatory helix-turn-helix, lysR family protein n=2 Tax=Collimonas arenae TaxID=279058 RepID=A0A127QDC9_9BURK|nr:bacterial regulatory helix-turn-helix, lysR family protein [Collimonas arenae]AMP08034.1 bacterial regulatory helix-turn-helix, lysR family protein [Collimonas arenae]
MAVFVRVVEKGSFARAAEDSDMSTTMVANHVRSLEEHLGARLLERTTRRHSLTEIGSVYLERCRDVLSSVQAADHVAEALRAVPRGKLRMTAPVTYGAHRLVPLIGEYMALFPEVQVELVLNDRVVDMVEEGFEVALRSGSIGNANLVARPLRPSSMLAVASPAYLQRHGKPMHPAELAGHNCLCFMPWGRDSSWRFSRGEETVELPVRGAFACNNGQALLTAALHGIGVVVQADVLLEDAIASGKLVHLLPEWSLPTRSIHLVRTRDARPTPKLRTFVDFLVQRLG